MDQKNPKSEENSEMKDKRDVTEYSTIMEHIKTNQKVKKAESDDQNKNKE
ncbi:hypothetical protein GKZ89_08660 [Bacillus mangrovi]|uniref:DUF4025 domain-containing protein n=1 Tax=Metabacillus mangrovi TaxID=1491830 RepID=A0A7X2V4Y6_9BACI|nr:hypothetical protein [Metabacillus mangrovi]MTH53488.1 hypothetical protein [Metabacillus mangrovi]